MEEILEILKNLEPVIVINLIITLIIGAILFIFVIPTIINVETKIVEEEKQSRLTKAVKEIINDLMKENK